MSSCTTRAFGVCLETHGLYRNRVTCEKGEESLNLGGNLWFLESVKVRTGISQEAKAAHLSSSKNKEEIKFSSAEHVFLELRVSLCLFPLLFLVWN